MRRLIAASALPLAALAAACGSEQELTTTNTGNVVLNDSQANYAFTGDNEMTNAMAMEDAAVLNGADANAGAMANMQ